MIDFERELAQEQARHRETLAKFYSDPEFKVILERRERERYNHKTAEYSQKLLLEQLELTEVIADTTFEMMTEQAAKTLTQ